MQTAQRRSRVGHQGLCSTSVIELCSPYRALAKEQGAQLLVFDLAALLPPSQLQPPSEHSRGKGPAIAAAMAASTAPALMPDDDDGMSTCDGAAPVYGLASVKVLFVHCLVSSLVEL